MIRAIVLAMGLVTGTLDVEVQLTPGADTVPHSMVIYLDGEPAAQIGTSPWKTWIELGEALKPRELVVVTRDADGREIDRATRWLNVYEPPEAATNLETPVTVLLDDASLGGSRSPEGLEFWIEVDGKPAEVLEITYPPAELWVVRDPKAQNQIERAATLALASELDLEDAVGLFDGQVLCDGPEAVRAALAAEPRFAETDDRRLSEAWDGWRALFPLEDGTEMHFVSPWGAPVSQIEMPKLIFSTTPPMDANAAGVPFNLFTTPPLGRWYRLADAVAIAGLQSTARARRRAVVVMTSGRDSQELAADDQSLYDVSTVRGYLAELGVPLRIWTFAAPDDDEDRKTVDPKTVDRKTQETEETKLNWSPIRSVAPGERIAANRLGEPGFGLLRDLAAAHAELIRTLQRQRIVWIRGRHLPGSISLSSEATGVRLVRDIEGVLGAERAKE